MKGEEVSAQLATAFERAARYEAVCRHRDQHRDVAKATRLGWGPVWCWVCGFTVRIKAQK